MAKSLSYAERHAHAVETFKRFMPGQDPERSEQALRRRMGALGSFAFEMVGEMWDRPQLSRRDRSLFIIAVLAAQARDEELETHTRIGLRHGLARVEIEEILLHIAAYAGFPAAMAASRRVDAGLRAEEGVDKLSDRTPALSKSDAERDRDAMDVFRTLSGGRGGSDAAADLAGMESMLGDVGVTAYRWAFGEIWSRSELSRRDRSIVVIAILISLGAKAELTAHIAAGRTHGLSQAEIEEVVHHLSIYVGFPRAVEAMRIARAPAGSTG
ncbi:MAG: carboxymuconolactone decarboxylase family protein [Gammaproteobacteria bacterium]